MRQKLCPNTRDNVQAVVPKLPSTNSSERTEVEVNTRANIKASTEINVSTERNDQKGATSAAAGAREVATRRKSTLENERIRNVKPDIRRYYPTPRRIIRMVRNQSAPAQHSTPVRLRDNTSDVVRATNAPVGSNDTAAQAMPDRCDEEKDRPKNHLVEVETGDSTEPLLGSENGENHQPSRSMLERYSDALDSGTLVTKCVTSAVIGGLGDIGAQGIQQACGGPRIWSNNEVRTARSDRMESK